MPTFLIISRHSAENCPLNNEKMKAMTLALPAKLVALEKKHGVKRVGAWTVVPEHLMKPQVQMHCTNSQWNPTW
jgi:hypothetical protein